MKREYLNGLILMYKFQYYVSHLYLIFAQFFFFLGFFFSFPAILRKVEGWHKCAGFDRLIGTIVPVLMTKFCQILLVFCQIFVIRGVPNWYKKQRNLSYCRNFGKKGSKTAEISAVLDVSNQTGNGQKNPNSVSNETV